MPGVLQQDHVICSGELYAFCVATPGVPLGPVNSGTSDLETSSDHASGTVHYVVSSRDFPSRNVRCGQKLSLGRWKWDTQHRIWAGRKMTSELSGQCGEHPYKDGTSQFLDPVNMLNYMVKGKCRASLTGPVSFWAPRWPKLCQGTSSGRSQRPTLGSLIL